MAAACYIFDDNNNVLEDFLEVTADVNYKTRVIHAPLETGQKSLDHKVIDPKEIHVTGYVEYDCTHTFLKLDKMLACKDFKFFQIMHNGFLIENLMLESMTSHKDTENVDLVKYDLVYVEALLVQTSESRPKSPSHIGTSSTGRVSG